MKNSKLHLCTNPVLKLSSPTLTNQKNNNAPSRSNRANVPVVMQCLQSPPPLPIMEEECGWKRGLMAKQQVCLPVCKSSLRCGVGPIVCVHVRHKQGYLFQTDIGLWLPDYGTVQSTLREADFCHARMCFFFTFCADLTAPKIKQLHLSIFHHFEALSNKVREDDWLWLAMIEMGTCLL